MKQSLTLVVALAMVAMAGALLSNRAGILSFSQPAHGNTAAKNPSVSAPSASVDSPYRRLPRRTVRIAILNGVDTATVRTDGPFRLTDSVTGELKLNGLKLSEATVRPYGNSGLTVGAFKYDGCAEIDLVSVMKKDIVVSGNPCGDSIRIIRDGDALIVLALMDIEDYLAGVVAGEMPVSSWPMEALKAQAVASRTFVAHRMISRNQARFDVTATTQDQVFNAKNSTHARALEAVLRTRGEVLAERGELFCAYFHSACGGETASASDVFDGDTPLALTGRTSDTCHSSPLYRWQRTLSLREIEDALKGLTPVSGPPVEKVYDIFPVFKPGRSVPARAIAFDCVHRGGMSRFKANAFRLAVGGGPTQLPSVSIERWDVSDGVVKLSGRGFGHGVGLCQHCAKAMADDGKTYRQILSWFYFRSQVLTIDEPTGALILK
ncbi:MAG: SpoIID/LytB domain-containing protein [Planctomycetota bacterium]